MFGPTLIQAASDILQQYKQKSLWITTAESCTGGLIASLFTEIPGSSAVFERGFITYSNKAKTEMLGVDKALLEKYGAVSSQVAQAMAQGALKNSKSDIAIAVTGIAGPNGGTATKPVGLVFIAVATKKNVTYTENFFTGNRSDIRMQSVAKALEMIAEVACSLSLTKGEG